MNSNRNQRENFPKCLHETRMKLKPVQIFLTKFRVSVKSQQQCFSCSSNQWLTCRDFVFSRRKFHTGPSSKWSELIRVGPASEMSETGLSLLDILADFGISNPRCNDLNRL